MPPLKLRFSDVRPREVAEVRRLVDAARARQPRATSRVTKAARFVLLTKAARPLQGRVTWRGLQISIENAPGSVRRGTDHDGTPWSTGMVLPYGYIRLTEGVDGDHVDCFLGPDDQAPEVYVITTRKAPHFRHNDEQKCMLGFQSAEDAKRAFFAHYDDPRHFGSIITMPFDAFKRKVLATKDTPALLRP
jgi:hypothetical protein